jgi:uncharacterized membrane protein YbhN (UPF0104 family)
MPLKLVQKIRYVHPTTRKLAFFALKIFVAVLMLTILVRRMSFERLFEALSLANNRYIFLAFILLFWNIYLQFLKWELVVYRENASVKKRHVLFSLFVGLALGLVTPGRVGDFGRAFFIKNVEWARLLGLLMVDKLITLAVLYLLGIIGLSHFISMRMHPFVWLPIFMMTIGLVLLFLIFLLRPEILRSIISRYHRFLSRYGAIEKFMTGIELATPWLTMRLLAITVVHTMTYCSQFVFLMLAFHKIPLIDGFLSAFAIMFTKSLLPLAIGDLGIRESASVYFLGQFGVSDVAAFNASFLLFVSNILLPSLVGLVLLIIKRQNSIATHG